MKFKGPIMTLAAGAALAGIIYTLNVDLKHDVARNNAAATQKAAAAAAAQSKPPAPAPPASSAAAPASSAPARGDGSGEAAKQGTVTYAGAVDGGAASLGLVVNNGKAIAYVCDGKAAEAWLDGPMADGIVELKSAKGSLTGTYANGQVKGSVTAGGKSWAFTIKVVTPPSGLYRSQASLRKKLDASWVVLPDGTQVGVKNTNGLLAPAPRFDLDSRTATVDGTPVTIEPTTPATGY